MSELRVAFKFGEKEQEFKISGSEGDSVQTLMKGLMDVGKNFCEYVHEVGIANSPNINVVSDTGKEYLIDMVKGVSPSYSVFSNPLVKKCGNYIGGFVDKWEWNNNELESLNGTELIELYNTCKQ